MTIKNSQEKLRFGVVGVANTAIDFGLLFGLRALGVPVVTANILSTSVAFCFSFFANKKYTFRAPGTANIKREIISFIIVTLFGLWVIQTGIISLIVWCFGSSAFTLFIAKLVATIASLTWNYVLYSRVVFKKEAT